MGLISQSEAEYIFQGLEKGIRNDGRLPTQYRPISLETGVLQQSSGSARCQLGFTEVLVSVKVRTQESRCVHATHMHELLYPCQA